MAANRDALIQSLFDLSWKASLLPPAARHRAGLRLVPLIAAFEQARKDRRPLAKELGIVRREIAAVARDN